MPKGIVVLLVTVKVGAKLPVEIVLLIVTALNVTLEASTLVLDVEVPSKVTVPELWVNVGELEVVKLPEIVMVALVLVKAVPALERVKLPLMSMAASPPVNVPPN